MRVIAGLRKGFKLEGPRKSKARPTEDKIKETIFNILYPMKHDAVVLDLFACTGSIGIEFLSRGAKKVFFSELNYDNIKILNQNLEKTKFTDTSIVLGGDYKKNIKSIDEDIDYVFIDPPYYTNYYEKSIRLMLEIDYFKNSSFITEADRHMDFTEKFDELKLVFQRQYGKKEISIYERLEK